MKTFATFIASTCIILNAKGQLDSPNPYYNQPRRDLPDRVDTRTPYYNPYIGPRLILPDRVDTRTPYYNPYIGIGRSPFLPERVPILPERVDTRYDPYHLGGQSAYLPDRLSIRTPYDSGFAPYLSSPSIAETATNSVTITNMYNVDFPCLLSMDGKEWTNGVIRAGSERTFQNAKNIRFRKSSKLKDKTERDYALKNGQKYLLTFDKKAKEWNLSLVRTQVSP